MSVKKLFATAAVSWATVWGFPSMAAETTPNPEPGAAHIYVVGDSISTPGAWPVILSALTGRHTFSQAIGGTTSPSMVKRARGVELVCPLTNPATPGVVHMRWNRHIADRTSLNNYRAQWACLAKQVSEPSRIEVYRNGRLLGLAKRMLKSFTTDYVRNQKAAFCPQHGLKAGDQVTFISNDPDYPEDLSVSDKAARWNFTSPRLPGAVIERRVYFAANVTPDSFEIKELANDSATLDIGGNAVGTQSIETGWTFDVDYAGGPWDVTWASRTKYDDAIWVLEVSANDIPGTGAITKNTIPNTQLLLSQMTGENPRYLLLCPPTGSFGDRGPGKTGWTNYHDIYMPWVQTNHPDNYVDIMAIWAATRTAKELSLLKDPKTPELLWITGRPTDETSWKVYREATEGAIQMWVGPGFTPLHLRTSFSDGIHPNQAGNRLIANAVAAFMTKKGW